MMKDFIGIIITILSVAILTKVKQEDKQFSDKEIKNIRKVAWWIISILIVFLILYIGFTFWRTKNY